MNEPDPYRAAEAYHSAVPERPTWLSIVLGLAAAEIVFSLTWHLLVEPLTANMGATASALIQLSSFVLFGATAFWLASRFQRRSPATLFGPASLALQDAMLAAKGTGILYLALIFLPPWDFSHYTLNLAPVAWMLLLPFSFVALFIQVTAEEVVFRGWLQQSLARISPSPVIWMGIPSVLFGLAHWSPETPPDQAMAYVIWATAFGLACADLTARTGTLGTAIGFHMTTNIISILITAVEGPVDGLALFTTPADEVRAEINAITVGFDLFFLWMAWMACRIAIRR